jgi:single-strand DNA-binding protein
MASVNKVILIGNLTRDPEVRYTPKGNAVAELALATNRYFTQENGEKREETTFIDVTLWGRQAELAQQYLQKGRPVYIEGRLQLDSWEDKQSGQKRSKLKVVGEVMQFLGGREGGGGGGGEGGGGGSYESRGGGGGGGFSRGGGESRGSGGDSRGGGRPSPPDNDGAQFDTRIDEDDDIPF